MIEILLMVVLLSLVAIHSGQEKARLRLEGRCEVCAKQKPLCDTCGRCLDPKCNGGCIYCRQDLPFGRKLRGTR